jgi:hypothetical protein
VMRSRFNKSFYHRKNSQQVVRSVLKALPIHRISTLMNFKNLNVEKWPQVIRGGHIIEIAPTSEGEGYFDRTDC